MATEAELICSVRNLGIQGEQLSEQRQKIDARIDKLQIAIELVSKAEAKKDAIFNRVSGVNLSESWRGSRFDAFDRSRSLGGEYNNAARDYVRSIEELRQNLERLEKTLIQDSRSLQGKIKENDRQMRVQRAALEHFKE